MARGFDINAKQKQGTLGGSVDCCGRLFTRGDDGAELAAAEKVLLKQRLDLGTSAGL
jgi:hypothetical protein